MVGNAHASDHHTKELRIYNMIKNNWNTTDIPDQTDRVAIVTGSNSGIGFETAKTLAAKNADVIMACRSMDKAQRALEKLKKGLPNAKIRIMSLDLSDLESITNFCELFRSEYSRLDLLINNAGVMVPPYSKTKDGFELQMGTNHLGHFALTGKLLDMLETTPDSRIVSVSSAAHNFGKPDFTDLHWEHRKYKPWRAYGDSKVANLYFIYHLADLLSARGSNIVCAAAHPGWSATELQRNTGLVSFLNPIFGQDSTMGALPTLYAACGTDVVPKDYFGPSGFMEMKGHPKKVKSNGLSHDKTMADRLWKISENLTGVNF